MHERHAEVSGLCRIAYRRNYIQLLVARKERRDGTAHLSRRSHDQHSYLVAHAWPFYLAAMATGSATTDSTASAMMSATASGLEINGAWLEGTDRTVAPIRFAINS